MTNTTGYDPDVALGWFREIELLVAKGGWDQEHKLWVASTEDLGPSSDDDGPRIGVVSWTALPLPGSDMIPTELYLELLADAFRDHPEGRHIVLDHVLDAPLVAIAFVCEALAIPFEDREQWKDRSFKSHPKVVETRHVLGVDIAGQTYSVYRQRGHGNHEVKATRGSNVSMGTVPNQLCRIIGYLMEGPE